MRYVYLVRAGTNQYKIGVSRNVEKRVATLQTSNINLVEIICAKRTTIDSQLEKSLHKKVREFSGTGGKEWFHLTPIQALEVAIEISKAPEVDIAENVIQDLKKEMSKIIQTYEDKISLEIDQLKQQRRQFEDNQRPTEKNKVLTDESRETQRKYADEGDYLKAKEVVIQYQRPSTSFLQRRMRIGYAKAARFIERMEEEGIVSPLDGIHRDLL